MREGSFLRTVIGGRMEWKGEMPKEKPRHSLLDWIMKDGYSRLKDKAKRSTTAWAEIGAEFGGRKTFSRNKLSNDPFKKKFPY